MKFSNLKLAILVGFAFFVLGVVTLPSYGINWDTINHLPRGQAYLHYFLTGNKDFNDLPKFFSGWQTENQWYFQDPRYLGIKTDVEGLVPPRSLYENSGNDFNYFMKHDGYGHPPLSDVISASFNKVLFGQLHLVNDIDSYRIYGVLLAAILVGLVFYWISSLYGKLAGFISAATISLYPLFFSESHFNTEKDIPQTAFWGLTIFSIWQTFRKKSFAWGLLTGIFTGLALGTKLNIVFLPFVVVPWIIYYVIKNGINIKPFLGLFVGAILSLIIFVGSWPYLWPDVIGRIGSTLSFYSDIGTTVSFPKEYIGIFGINTYPFQWILYSTPPVVILLVIFGLIFIIKNLNKEKHGFLLLALLWFLVPIARVSLPGTNIYGGVRQIMEFIPGMALVVGIGATYLFSEIKKLMKGSFVTKNISVLKVFFIVLLVAIMAQPVINNFPNENVYFNFIVGGLKGARARNMPGWGNTFGAAYRQGAVWLNQNVEPGANLVYAFELIPNIPRIWLRQDINLHNSNRSGYLARGEYAITLTYSGSQNRSYYDDYLENFLTPVYQVRSDGVSILKIWKNDKSYYKQNYIETINKNTKFTKNIDYLLFDLGSVQKLARLEINYFQNNCSELLYGFGEISTDGEVWQRLPGNLPDDWRISALKEQPQNGGFIEPFVGQEARFIRLNLNPSDTCLKNVRSFRVYTFSTISEE